MPDTDYILQFHADLETVVETEVEGVAEKVRGAWTVGGCDVSKPVINFLWYRNLGLREKYMANGGSMATFENFRQFIRNLSVEKYGIDETVETNTSWCNLLKEERGKIVFYATSPRIVEYLRPVICAMDESFVLLTPYDVGYVDELPDCATVVKFSLSNIVIFKNELLARHFPLVYCFANTIGSYIQALRPRLLVCMDGCQTEYELAALFCKQIDVPSVCIQQGWPSMLHEGFHDMPYTHFLTWGRGFNELWKKRNHDVDFMETGYLYDVKSGGAHFAITFFMQAPVFLLTADYLDRMYRLVVTVAERYKDRIVLVREHPEYKADAVQKEKWAALSNIRNVSNMPLAEVFAQTCVAVSCFSSSIMESVVHGCVPLVFSPATGVRYSPDIEKEHLGLISVSEEEFLVKLNDIIEHNYKPIKENDAFWFSNIGNASVCATINIIKGLTK